MADIKKPNVKSKVEAVLFSVGHKISLDEISKLCRSHRQEVLSALQELRKEYDEKQSSIMLVEEGESWKFSVRDHLISVVRKIVTETELSKSIMETLAVIAFKYPILQSDMIKIRTNKAYDHLVELEKSGYISRQKHGRTNLIKLTEKFFKYFDLTEEKLKDQFRDFDSIAKAIKEKEIEVDNIKGEQAKRAQELKQQDDKIRKEIESLDEAGEEFSIPVPAYDAQKEKSNPKQEEIKKEQNEKKESSEEMMGNLEVVEVQKEEQKHKEQEKQNTEIKQENNPPKENQETSKQVNAENISEDKSKHEADKEIKSSEPAEHRQKVPRKHKGISMTPAMEKQVDKRVEEIVHGKEEDSDKDNSETPS